MDYKSALDTLDDLYTFGHGWGEFTDREEIEKQRKALDAAIYAIKKQIPTKPIIKPWNSAKCPCCNFSMSEHLGDGYYKHYMQMKICDKCGQMLDWSGAL